VHNSRGIPRGLALIFDLDGVIVDSMPLHTRAWRVYLERLGITATDHDIEHRMHGRHNADIVEVFIGSRLTAQQIFDHGAAKEQLYRELMGTDLKHHLVPGIQDFLEYWSELPLAIGSNAEPLNVDLVLDGAGLRSRFQAIVDGHQVEHPKPAPDVYLRAAKLLNIAPADCVVFEDSPGGIQAARAAGMRVVGVQTHSADLRDVDLRIRDFRDGGLGSWLDSIAVHA